MATVKRGYKAQRKAVEETVEGANSDEKQHNC
jgi:hypothetical protein